MAPPAKIRSIVVLIPMYNRAALPEMLSPNTTKIQVPWAIVGRTFCSWVIRYCRYSK